MMRIEKAAISQYPDVRSFYHSLIDGIADLPYGAGWKKDIYPAPEYLKESIRDGNLYIGLDGDAIIAAMVVNHQCNDGYREFRWPTEAAENEVTVIHALGVHPSRSGKGYGRQMVRFVMELARRNR
ncbi:MAG: GNAT family N-acetyltransferase, partial [Clostridia bacterium]|nr:GNAT family N-acetyltransferase [Clostridia bacterium]